MLQRYYAIFGQSQIFAIDYDMLAGNPGKLMRELFEFLAVDPNFAPRIKRLNPTVQPRHRGLDGWVNGYKNGPGRKVIKKLVASVGAGQKAKEFFNRMNRIAVEDDLPAATYDRLIEFYREDAALLSQLTGQSYSHWFEGRSRAA